MHCSTSHRVLLQTKYLLSDDEIDPNIFEFGVDTENINKYDDDNGQLIKT